MQLMGVEFPCQPGLFDERPARPLLNITYLPITDGPMMLQQIELTRPVQLANFAVSLVPDPLIVEVGVFLGTPQVTLSVRRTFTSGFHFLIDGDHLDFFVQAQAALKRRFRRRSQ